MKTILYRNDVRHGLTPSKPIHEWKLTNRASAREERSDHVVGMADILIEYGIRWEVGGRGPEMYGIRNILPLFSLSFSSMTGWVNGCKYDDDVIEDED